jgi:hypothetical protein
MAGLSVWGQTGATLKGSVSHLSEPLQGVYLHFKNINRVTQTDGAGKFSIRLPAETDIQLEVTYLRMITKSYSIRLKNNEIKFLNVELEEEVREETAVEITARKDLREQVGVVTLDPKIAKLMPSPFGDFNKVLATLPGVVSNNELSSSYSVRGGNFS